MNELLKVEINDNQEPVMSARDLHEFLDSAKDFTEFFINVSEYRIRSNKSDLKMMREVLRSFVLKYGSDAITHLMDIVDIEMTLPCNQEVPRKFKEKQLQNNLLDNFCYAFPSYDLVGAEIPVNGIGRIDILAKDRETERPVIIELKIGGFNPNKQLLAYASEYENPVLIGVTETKIKPEMRNKDILYFTFLELKEGASQWVI